MGRSFIAYRGRGFWTGDSKIEVWLFLLCVEIDRTEAYLTGWFGAATIGTVRRQSWFVGCVSPSLDQHLGDDYGRVEGLLILSERARSRLMVYGAIIPMHVLNSFGTGGLDSDFVAEVELGAFLPVPDAFSALLRDAIAWDTATSPVI
jgi:hypothetical protein